MYAVLIAAGIMMQKATPRKTAFHRLMMMIPSFGDRESLMMSKLR